VLGFFGKTNAASTIRQSNDAAFLPGLQLPTVGCLELHNCFENISMKGIALHPNTANQPIVNSCCYALGFVELSSFFRLKYSTISSFVILESFSLNFSLCSRMNFTASNVFLAVVFIGHKISW